MQNGVPVYPQILKKNLTNLAPGRRSFSGLNIQRLFKMLGGDDSFFE
jgi:hypothetical protein